MKQLIKKPGFLNKKIIFFLSVYAIFYSTSNFCDINICNISDLEKAKVVKYIFYYINACRNYTQIIDHRDMPLLYLGSFHYVSDDMVRFMQWTDLEYDNMDTETKLLVIKKIKEAKNLNDLCLEFYNDIQDIKIKEALPDVTYELTSQIT